MANLSEINLNNGTGVGAKREGMDSPSHSLALMPSYEAYKDSGVEWLGDIPASWSLLANKHIFRLKKKQVGKRSNEYDLLSLTLRGVIKRDMENPEGKFPAEFDTYQEVNEGDFVFCLFDVEETPRTVGLSPYYGMITGAYTVFETAPDFDKRFIYYFYLNLDEKKRLKPLYTGLRNTISKDAFLSFKTFVPRREEQTLIANFLDQKTAQIDAAIAIKEQQIELLKERKQIIIQQAVTQGLDPNVPMKDSGVDWIGKIPAHWGITPIKRICEAYGRIGFRGYNTSDLVNEGEGAITLSPSNLTEYEMDFTKCSYLSWEKYYESPEIQIMESDILIVKTGSSFGKTGFVNYLPMKATINPQLLVLKSIKVNCKYLYLLISSSNWQEQIKKRVIGSTIPTISETRLLSMQATVPPEEEQDKIILYIDEKLSEIDEIINLQHEQVNLFKEYKTTLINSAVTGKIKITPEMVEQ